MGLFLDDRPREFRARQRPTYRVFLQFAGGDAGRLMTELAPTLTALSAGAVFMGTVTYIGNAPNFMVRTIAQHHGVRMPNFFGYLAWSGAIPMPLFRLPTLTILRLS